MVEFYFVDHLHNCLGQIHPIDTNILVNRDDTNLKYYLPVTMSVTLNLKVGIDH